MHGFFDIVLAPELVSASRCTFRILRHLHIPALNRHVISIFILLLERTRLSSIPSLGSELEPFWKETASGQRPLHSLQAQIAR